MNSNRQIIQRMLRASGLLGSAEKFRYLASLAKCYRKNREFVSVNPGFKIPPKALAYDAYSAPDWDFYRRSGVDTAAFLAGIAKNYFSDAGSIRVLEWGCGPGRVIRHLQTSLGAAAEIYGSDYNQATITWCRENFPSITFVLNGLGPPLPFEPDFFRFIYSISVFTHLSESISQQWVAELRRIVRPGGILVVTTNGDALQKKMLPDELEAYRTSGIVIRDKFEEGKRCFMACHSPRYVRETLS